MELVTTPTWVSDISKLTSELEKRRIELGMPRAVLAKLARVSAPTVTRILRNRETAPKLPVIRAIAVALKVEIRLGETSEVFPRVDAYEYREQRARIKAIRLVHGVQGSMGLEAQAVSAATVNRMVDQTVHELLAGSKRKLWED
jgi:transcriptional regulator with XRE-family HTH domain